MTSNQIAAEANVIQKQMNEWTKEHNDEYRAEMQRHNTEMEKLQEQQILAQEHGNRIQENWNRWQEQWQRDYQYQLQKLQLANEEQRTSIQAELASLEERKVVAEEGYKAAQEANLVYMQGIASDQLALDTSYKEWEKDFKEKTYKLNEYQAFVENKRVEYEYSLRHEQNLISRQQNENTRNWQIAQNVYNYALLNWEREKTTRQLNNALALGNYNYQVGMANIDVQRENLELYAKKVRAENFNSYSSGLFGRSGIIPGTLGAVSSGIQLFGGFQNGKTAIKVAEALLFK